MGCCFLRHNNLLASTTNMRVFLSHNSNDKSVAERIGKALIPRNIIPWLDKWDLFAGESLTTKIGDAIDQCDAFIILLSPNSVGSKWVKEELRIALQRRFAEDNFKIIPIVLADCPIPPFLRDYKHIDLRHGESAGIQALLAAFHGVSSRPDLSNILPGISYKQALQTIVFVGRRGEQALISESYEAIPLRRLLRVDRNLYFSGRLAWIKSDKFLVTRRAVTPNYEKLTLCPKSRYDKGKTLKFFLKYKLLETFANDEEYWVYSIEAPTDVCTIILDFDQSSPPETVTVSHRQGQTPIPEPIQPSQHGNRFVWKKTFPEYKDAYEFQIRWPT